MMRVSNVVRVASLAAAAWALVSVAHAQQPSDPAIEDWKPEKLVNVEILPKTMAPDDVIKLMKSYNAALNVDCVFCHKGQVGKPWSTYDFTDTTKKRHETSRLMMRTTNDLNQNSRISATWTTPRRSPAPPVIGARATPRSSRPPARPNRRRNRQNLAFPAA